MPIEVRRGIIDGIHNKGTGCRIRIEILAEGEGFEPPKACTLVVFKPQHPPLNTKTGRKGHFLSGDFTTGSAPPAERAIDRSVFSRRPPWRVAQVIHWERPAQTNAKSRVIRQDEAEEPANPRTAVSEVCLVTQSSGEENGALFGRNLYLALNDLAGQRPKKRSAGFGGLRASHQAAKRPLVPSCTYYDRPWPTKT